MFVLSNQTAMHALSVYCMECLKYLFTKKIILSQRYVCVRCKKGAESSCGYVFFPVCGRMCVCMPNKKLHIFKSFLDSDCSCFFHLVNTFTAFVKLF